jgi:hypothetical protein
MAGPHTAKEKMPAAVIQNNYSGLTQFADGTIRLLA